MQLEPFGGANAELLFATYPLIRLLRGDKKAALQRAWIRSAMGVGADVLKIEEGQLPRDPRAATRALFRAVLEIAEAQGMSGVDLTDLFNERAERAEAWGKPRDCDEAVMRGFALLGVLCARRLVAQGTAAEPERKTA